MTLLLLAGLFDLSHHFKRRMIKVSAQALADQTSLSQDKVSATDLDSGMTTAGCYSGHLPIYQPNLTYHPARLPAYQITELLGYRQSKYKSIQPTY